MHEWTDEMVAAEQERTRAIRLAEQAAIIEAWIAENTDARGVVQYAPNSMMIRADARAIGAVTATDVRVSERWRPTAKRAVGTAPGHEGDGTPSMLVKRPGQPDEVVALTRGGRRARAASAMRATVSRDVAIQQGMPSIHEGAND
jgi:hypothetical protein